MDTHESAPITDEMQREPAASTFKQAMELTAREQEVLRFVKGGSTNAKIAQALGISEKTVEFHVRNILRKLGAANRTGAVVIAIRHRLIAA